jgi:hypothetical protein
MRIQFFSSTQIWKTQNKPIKYLSVISYCLELRMNYAPLTWYEQEYQRYKAHFEALPIAPCSLLLFSLNV